MYFVQSLLLLLTVSVVQPYSACNRGNWNHARRMFNHLSDLVINHDHDMKETCKHFKHFASREIFGGNAYRIEVIAPEFANAHWDVYIKHRVLYFNGHDPRVGKTCDLTYADIKVLPQFANTHAASWTFKDGMFIIALPYKYNLEQNYLSCNQKIDETLIHVRRGFPSDRIFCDA